jgi:hypothetical protein
MVSTLAIRDFKTADEMMEYYRVNKARFKAPSKPVTFKITPKQLPPIMSVVVASPPSPEPPATPVMLTTIGAETPPWPSGHTPSVEEFVDAVEKKLIFGSRANALRLAALLEARYDLKKDSLMEDGRSLPIVRVRQEWYWYLVRKFGLPKSRVGKLIGRDHTTILHGVRMHDERMGL